MGQLSDNDRTKMKAFVVCALVGLSVSAPAADISSHVVHHGHHLPVVAHAVHQPHHPVVHHAAPLLHHAVHPAPVVVPHHVAPAYPAPAPAYPAPAPAPYHEPKGKEEPYAFQYGVADDYSKANFNAAESSDGKVVSGSYSVALPDGRIQHVKVN